MSELLEGPLVEPLAELILVLLLSLGGTVQIWRSRSLEKRILSIERSLGALANLGAAGGGDPLQDPQALRKLLAVNEAWLADVKSNENLMPQPAKEP